MKKILFAIVLMLSTVNLSAVEINGVNFKENNFKETFSFNVIQITNNNPTKVTNEEAYVLFDYKFNNIDDGGTCKITFYWKTENGTYTGKSATYDNVYLAFIEKNGSKAYQIMDKTNGSILMVFFKDEYTMLSLNYPGDFNDVNIRFE